MNSFRGEKSLIILFKDLCLEFVIFGLSFSGLCYTRSFFHSERGLQTQYIIESSSIIYCVVLIKIMQKSNIHGCVKLLRSL